MLKKVLSMCLFLFMFMVISTPVTAENGIEAIVLPFEKCNTLYIFDSAMFTEAMTEKISRDNLDYKDISDIIVDTSGELSNDGSSGAINYFIISSEPDPDPVPAAIEIPQSLPQHPIWIERYRKPLPT